MDKILEMLVNDTVFLTLVTVGIMCGLFVIVSGTSDLFMWAVNERLRRRGKRLANETRIANINAASEFDNAVPGIHDLEEEL